MTPSPSPPRQVLVRRLLRVYDPWEALARSRDGFWRAMRAASPIAEYSEDGCEAYDHGRTLFLYECICCGWEPDPITIDSFFAYDQFAGVAINDGHHRLIAAHYAKRETIPAVVGGWVAMAEWLCGERRRMPEWGKR